MATGFQVTFDCADPERLGRFWADLLHYVEQPPPPGFDSWPSFLESVGVPPDKMDSAYAVIDPDGSGPRLFFQKVTEGKTAKNRIHLDVNVGGGHATPMEERRGTVDAEVERAVGLGATVMRPAEVSEMDEYWAVLQDPEGNEFCLQ